MSLRDNILPKYHCILKLHSLKIFLLRLPNATKKIAFSDSKKNQMENPYLFSEEGGLGKKCTIARTEMKHSLLNLNL